MLWKSAFKDITCSGLCCITRKLCSHRDINGAQSWKNPAFRGHFWCPLTGHHSRAQREHRQAGSLLHRPPCAICNLLNVFWETDSSLQHKNLRWQTICLGRKKSKGAYGMDRTEINWAPIAVATWCTVLMEKMAHFELGLPYLGHRCSGPECRTQCARAGKHTIRSTCIVSAPETSGGRHARKHRSSYLGSLDFALHMN